MVQVLAEPLQDFVVVPNCWGLILAGCKVTLQLKVQSTETIQLVEEATPQV